MKYKIFNGLIGDIVSAKDTLTSHNHDLNLQSLHLQFNTELTIISDLYVLNFISLASVFSSLLVILTNNPIISILYLIALFVLISCYIILLGASFLGLAYLLVYVGAISILFLFILMLINIRTSELKNITNKSLPLIIIIGIMFNIPIYRMLPGLNYEYGNINYGMANEVKQILNINWDSCLADVHHINSLGNLMYTQFSVWLFIASLILLLAMIGSIIITINNQNTSSDKPNIIQSNIISTITNIFKKVFSLVFSYSINKLNAYFVLFLLCSLFLGGLGLMWLDSSIYSVIIWIIWIIEPWRCLPLIYHIKIKSYFTNKKNIYYLLIYTILYPLTLFIKPLLGFYAIPILLNISIWFSLFLIYKEKDKKISIYISLCYLLWNIIKSILWCTFCIHVIPATLSLALLFLMLDTSFLGQYFILMDPSGGSGGPFAGGNPGGGNPGGGNPGGGNPGGGDPGGGDPGGGSGGPFARGNPAGDDPNRGDSDDDRDPDSIIPYRRINRVFRGPGGRNIAAKGWADVEIRVVDPHRLGFERPWSNKHYRGEPTTWDEVKNFVDSIPEHILPNNSAGDRIVPIKRFARTWRDRHICKEIGLNAQPTRPTNYRIDRYKLRYVKQLLDRNKYRPRR
jgi:NADH-ubiquinone oxidoreductase chain 6